MQLFYTPDIDINADSVSLSKEESKHIVRVLRMKEGNIIFLTDGKGVILEVKIDSANQNLCKVKVLKKTENYQKRNYHIHMAVSPTKSNDRYEWFLEKATEIGIDEITPIITRYSERKKIKLDRYKKVIISALKQSHKAYMPKINEAVSLKEFFSYNIEADKYIAHCHKEDKKSLKREIKNNRKYLILIGPEGDFSEEEIAMAIKKGFVPVSIGNFRLRTETAALAAVHSIAFANE